jgi:hypothetical protein
MHKRELSVGNSKEEKGGSELKKYGWIHWNFRIAVLIPQRRRGGEPYLPVCTEEMLREDFNCTKDCKCAGSFEIGCLYIARHCGNPTLLEISKSMAGSSNKMAFSIFWTKIYSQVVKNCCKLIMLARPCRVMVTVAAWIQRESTIMQHESRHRACSWSSIKN